MTEKANDLLLNIRLELKELRGQHTMETQLRLHPDDYQHLRSMTETFMFSANTPPEIYDIFQGAKVVIDEDAPRLVRNSCPDADGD